MATDESTIRVNLSIEQVLDKARQSEPETPSTQLTVALPLPEPSLTDLVLGFLSRRGA